MLKFTYVPGISCAHLWAPNTGANGDSHYRERCTQCASKCNRGTDGRISEYLAGPGIIDGARVYS
jgi:hypothetical protein